MEWKLREYLLAKEANNEDENVCTLMENAFTNGVLFE